MQADDDVINEAFKSHNKKPPADLRGLTGQVCYNNTITIKIALVMLLISVIYMYTSCGYTCIICQYIILVFL